MNASDDWRDSRDATRSVVQDLAAPEYGLLHQRSPLLEFLDVIRPVGEIELLQHRKILRCHAVARRHIAKLAVDRLAFLRQQEIDEKHGGMRMRSFERQRRRG